MLTYEKRLDAMNRLGRAMADYSRSRILLALLDAPSYPAQLSENLSLSRTNVSNHLACLKACGIVTTQSMGRRTIYSIASDELRSALLALLDVPLAADTAQTCIPPNDHASHG